MTRGFSWKELTDFDEGPDLETLLELKVEAAKYALEEQRKMVEAVSLGVAGLFSKDLLPKFFDSVERIVDKIEEAKGETKSKEQRHRSKMQKTMRELSKLNAVLGAPVPMK